MQGVWLLCLDAVHDVNTGHVIITLVLKPEPLALHCGTETLDFTTELVCDLRNDQVTFLKRTQTKVILNTMNIE